MKRTIWLDLDLDYFNYANDPKLEMHKLLGKLRPSTPAVIVVEHHRVVAHVRRAVSSGSLSTPCTVLHVDHHHDYYKNGGWDGEGTISSTPDCGCFMYFLEKQWYDNVVWVAPPDGSAETFCHMWKDARRWLRKNGKRSSCTEHPPWMIKKWDKHRVGFITFVISPDYLENTMRDSVEKIIGMIAKYFSLDTTVEPDNPSAGNSATFLTSPSSWHTVIRRNGKAIVKNRDNIALGRIGRG